jgi:cysteinyl-tRNA synthetase
MEWARLLDDIALGDNVDDEVLGALSDDLNTPAVYTSLHALTSAARANTEDRRRLKQALAFLGLYDGEKDTDFLVGRTVDAAAVEALIAKRNAARKAKNFAEADRLRAELSAMGVAIEDGPTGTTWKVMS